MRPRRDSPLWVMSVNRVHWPEYQQMMSGVGHTLRFTPASTELIDAQACPYPPPLVPPIELEIHYDKVPVDHSWGRPADRTTAPSRPAPTVSPRRPAAATVSTAAPVLPVAAVTPADAASSAAASAPLTMTRVGTFEGAWKWHGGVVAPDGKVYCIPCSGTAVLVVDAARGAAETFGNAGGSQAYKWNRACVGANGKIYAMPSHHPSVLVIDPATRQLTLLGHHEGRGSKWNDAISSPHDGRVYGLPFDASQLLVIDPARGTSHTTGSFGGGKYKWRVGLLAPDGRIFGMPYNHEAVLVIDPAAGGAVGLLPLPPSVAHQQAKWNGAVVGADGCIYAIPCNATAVLRIDPSTDELSLFGECGRGQSKWRNGVLEPTSGAIFAAPFDAPGVLMIEPRTSSVRILGELGSQKGKWADCTLGGDGRVYACPHTARGVLVVDATSLDCSVVGELADVLPPAVGSKMCGAYVECMCSGGAVVGVPVHATSALVITPPTSGGGQSNGGGVASSQASPSATTSAKPSQQQQPMCIEPTIPLTARAAVASSQRVTVMKAVAGGAGGTVSVADAESSPRSHHQAISKHLVRTDLIYGWEAARRTCIGAARAPLRNAAHRARAASDSLRSATRWDAADQHRAYCTCIARLFERLQAAGESDFDGLLREAVDGLLLIPPHDTKRDATMAVASSPLSSAQAAALVRIRDHRYRGSYKGKAADRDLHQAAIAAESVRVALGRLSSVTTNERERADATEAYVCAVDRLRAEVARGGELDMDGLLRQAVQLLDPHVRGRRGTGNLCIEKAPSSAELPSLDVPRTPSTSALLAQSSATHAFWFRKGLRVHDSPALLAARDAAAAAGVPLLAVFVLDPVTLGRGCRKRSQFLLEALHDLDASLRRTIDRPLLVLRGSPTVVLPLLWRQCGVTRCTWEVDTEAYATSRDAKVIELGTQLGVEVSALSGHSLHSLDELLALCPKGQPPTKYNDFLKLLEAAGPPAVPLPPPLTLPSICKRVELVLSVEDRTAMAVPTTVEELLKCVDSTVHTAAEDTAAVEGDAESRETCSFELRGGESAALERLATAVEARHAWVCAFSKPHTNPLEYAPGSTTMLSPYLALGCLSCRTLHAALDAAVASQEKRTSPPQSLHGQLYWREFFYLLSYATADFGTVRSPLCLNVPWREPALDTEAAGALRRWAEASTGVPLVDAAMRQLKSVGWLHHLLRHVVACFLTRGQLWVHWEAGRDVFEHHLLDADWAINSANWMWLSATCFFYTYHRVYSPAHFARKYDRSGRYVRAWLPALARLPDEYVYEPWKAPIQVQHAAGCVIGRDYPHPMCDPEAAAESNMCRMDACYRTAPDDWKALVPHAAATEVQQERGIDIRASRRRSTTFTPLARPAPPATVEAEAQRGADGIAQQPTTQVATTGSVPLGRSGGGRGRASGRGRGRGGRTSRIQHGLY